jgi:hypothetical protein
MSSASSPTPESARPRAAALLLALAIFATGLWLRLHQITIQVIGDDEWHALNFLKYATYEQIFHTFGHSDHSIPLTLYDRYVADNFGLSELAMRAPVLMFGFLALVVAPLLVRGLVGTRTAFVFAALLAISPLHVYFSRYARPYSAMFFFGFVGVLAFERWLATGRRGWAVLYAVCAILGPWFMPVVAPFLLSPFLFALFPRGDGRNLLRRFLQVVPLGLVVALGLYLLIGPPMTNDFATIEERAGHGSFDFENFTTVFHLVTGAPMALTAFLCGVAILVGAFSLTRTRPRLLAYMLFLTACQFAVIGWTGPDALEVPIVVVRYTLPAAGFALLLLAEGVTFLDDVLRREWRFWPGSLLPVLVVTVLLAFGPVLSVFDPSNRVYFRPNSFTNHTLFQYVYDRRERWNIGSYIGPEPTPFYKQLGRSADFPDRQNERIVEAPGYIDWGHSPFVVLQKVHKREVVVGFAHEPGEDSADCELPWPDPRFQFRNFVHLGDHERLRELGVRFVVMHKDLPGEMPCGGNPPAFPIQPWIERYVERYGPPYIEEEWIVVFDVTRTPPGSAAPLTR